MNFKYKKEVKSAFTVSIPIMMGYLVLGAAFGLLSVSLGFSSFLALAMSIFIYSGALQFIALSFFKIKMGFFDIALATFFINIRHSFYGLSLLKRFKSARRLKLYLIFALTDETYALLTSIKDKKGLKKRWYYLFLFLFSQGYWVIGTFIGILIGNNFKFSTLGLEFSLTALFVVLCIEQYKKIKKKIPFLIGFFVSIFCLILIPKDKMLILAILLSLFFLFIFKKVVENE